MAGLTSMPENTRIPEWLWPTGERGQESASPETAAFLTLSGCWGGLPPCPTRSFSQGGADAFGEVIDAQ
jgi:hypothetical protein